MTFLTQNQSTMDHEHHYKYIKNVILTQKGNITHHNYIILFWETSHFSPIGRESSF